MAKIRAVLDTNTVVSAILHGGTLGQLVEFWMQGRFVFCASKEIIEEYARVFAYPKFKLTPDEVHRIMTRLIIPYVEPVSPKTRHVVVKADPSDDKFIDCAVAGKATFIVSGDRHLKDLGTFGKIKIISGKEFLGMVG